MKTILPTLFALVFTLSSYAQVAYLQYRKVPADKTEEFVEKETQYWSKVAKAAIKEGKMSGWSLWRKIGVTHEDAPNFVFVNTFENPAAMYADDVWANLEAIEEILGVNPATVETNSFTTVTFDYVMQLEAMVPGDYKYALVNYAMPEDRNAFIQENINLWRPFHKANIDKGEMGMTCWGMMSVMYPTGNKARFSVMTWDGFNLLKDVMNYLRYQPQSEITPEWEAIMSKTKMGDILPNGFEWSIVYELVMSIGPDNE
ncbi:hypothetical protein [Robertkochia sediminum]|uniref:hypothetical protein n=1 Tax=Robertkochia sediminum TaxID=2785326 RepID=UPI001932962E|nr:hypothetical protein [Robertkochia sediminum]MBL7471278.1 hypothetical protein [Robertkochia sediminum]